MTTLQPSAIAALEARLAEHPWRTLGSAFLLGVWVGLEPLRAPRNAIARAALAMIGSIVIRGAREVALGELVSRAVRPTSPARPSWPARPMHL